MKKLYYLLFIIFIAGISEAQISPGPFYLPFDTTAGYGITAYFDLDNSTTIRDWTGWTSTGWSSGHAYDGHTGSDFGMTYYTVVLSALTGIVYGYNDGVPIDEHSAANYAEVRNNANTWQSIYWHLAPTVSNFISLNTTVNLGQQVGESDNTGNSTGPHLHFGAFKNGTVGCPYYNGWWVKPWVGCNVVKVTGTPDLNVRSGAGTGYSIITVIGQDAMFVSSQNSGGWYKIFLPGSTQTTGWCYGTYLSIIPATDVTEVVVSGTGSTLNVRSGPAASYGIITTVTDGQRYISLSKSSISGIPWYQIYLPGAPYSTGWCSSAYLVVYNDILPIIDWKMYSKNITP